MPEEREVQWLGLAERMHRCVNSAEENLGHMEEELLRGSHEMMRQMLEKAAQAKAAAAAARCPVCGQPLRCLNGPHPTTIQTRFGSIRVERVRGKCRRCHKWRFPADAVLGLPAEGTQSPAVQEIAALTVSKMPAAEAEQVVERLTRIHHTFD